MSEPDSEAVERMLARAEAALRRLGFTERTIKAKRPSTRAQVVAHLRSCAPGG